MTDANSDAVRSIQSFTADLYRRLAGANGNLVAAPFSAATALGMALAGARGGTAEEMARVLHSADPTAFGEPISAVARRQLDLPAGNLAKRGHEAPSLDLANAIWAQLGHDWNDTFLATLASGFGAELQSVDYANDAAGATRQINDWVAKRTHDKITQLVDGLDSLTRMVLVNAAYFKAQWVHPFKGRTEPAPFTFADGSRVDVEMMSGSLQRAGYARGDGWQALRLDFISDQLAMAVVLPDEQVGLTTFESALDGDRLARLLTSFEPQPTANLKMPRWTFRNQFLLNDHLTALGMPTAFDQDRADFSGMTTDDVLYINAVMHEAYIAVDEEGAEATAATAVVMATRAAALRPPLELTVDRPFLFVIFDAATALPLFIGRVADPR